MANISSNELFSRNLISNISTLLNMPEEVVDNVLSVSVLHILKDMREQRTYSSDNKITIRIPRVADINLSVTDKSISILDVYLIPRFREDARLSVIDGEDLLVKVVEGKFDDMIIDKFVDIISAIDD